MLLDTSGPRLYYRWRSYWRLIPFFLRLAERFVSVTARSGISGFRQPRGVVFVPDAPDVLGGVLHVYVVAALEKVRAEREVTRFQYGVYFLASLMGLHPLDSPVAQRAAQRALSHCKKFPICART